MPSARYYHWLLYFLAFNELPNFFRSSIPIHDRHWTIHKDDTIRLLAFLIRSYNEVKSLLACVRTINNRLYVWISWLLQDNCKSKHIIGFIVNYHDPSILIHLYNIFIFMYLLLEVLEIIPSFTIFNKKFLIINLCLISSYSCLASEYHITITFIIFEFTFLFIFFIKLHIFILLGII